jgi:hypothetical protein
VTTKAWERESTQFDMLSTARLMASRTVVVRRSPMKAGGGLGPDGEGQEGQEGGDALGHLVGFLSPDGFVLDEGQGDASAVPLVVHPSVLQGVGACVSA